VGRLHYVGASGRPYVGASGRQLLDTCHHILVVGTCYMHVTTCMSPHACHHMHVTTCMSPHACHHMHVTAYMSQHTCHSIPTYPSQHCWQGGRWVPYHAPPTCRYAAIACTTNPERCNKTGAATSCHSMHHQPCHTMPLLVHVWCSRHGAPHHSMCGAADMVRQKTARQKEIREGCKRRGQA